MAYRRLLFIQMSRTRLNDILARRNGKKAPATVATSSGNNKKTSEKAAVTAALTKPAPRPSSAQPADREKVEREARERVDRERAALEAENQYEDESYNPLEDDDRASTASYASTASFASTASHASTASTASSIASLASLNLNDKRGRRQAQEEEEELYDDDDQQEQSREPSPPAPVASKKRGAPARQPRSEEPEPATILDLLPRQSIARLIKSTGVAGAGSMDMIEATREILQEVVQDSVKNVNAINGELVGRLIESHFASEADLPEDVCIAPTAFDRFVRAIIAEQDHPIAFKREASYIFHLFCEGYLIKMIKGADLVASSSKRSRIQGGDLTVAYHIYNM